MSDENNIGSEEELAQKQLDAQKAAQDAVSHLQRDPDLNPPPGNPVQMQPEGVGQYNAAAAKAREQEETRSHPFVVAVKALLDALAPEPKLGAVESTYFAVRREYNELTGAADARAAVTGGGSEHETLRESAD